MRKLKIAYAIQNVGGIDLSTSIGDAGPVRQLVQGLSRLGHCVTVFKLDGQKVSRIEQNSGWDAKEEGPYGMSATRPFRYLEGGIRRIQREASVPYLALFDTFRFYEAGIRFLKNFDICHEHIGLLSPGTALACIRLGIPYLLTFSADPIFEHGLYGEPLRGVQRRLASWEAKLTYRIARKIICVSEAGRQQLIDRWQIDPIKIVVVPNGVDTNMFRPKNSASSVESLLGLSPNGNPIIAFMGGFQPWHGLDHLVESYVMVRARQPNAKLLLVGDGPERPAIEEMVQRHGVEDGVIFTGQINQDEVSDLLSLADIAVLPYPQLPSELWFSPLKLYEYMAAGKAIVASNSGQIADMIDEGSTGCLVEPGDTKAFAEAILRLIRYPGLRRRLGKAARLKSLEEHTWDRRIRQIEQTYLSVLAG